MTRLTLGLLATTPATSSFAAERDKQWCAVEGTEPQSSFAGKQLGDSAHDAYVAGAMAGHLPNWRRIFDQFRCGSPADRR